jgi:hypothetical protein
MYNEFLYDSEYGTIVSPLTAGSILCVRKNCRNFDWLNNYQFLNNESALIQFHVQHSRKIYILLLFLSVSRVLH